MSAYKTVTFHALHCKRGAEVKHEVIVSYEGVGAMIHNLFEHGVEMVDAVKLDGNDMYRITLTTRDRGDGLQGV